VGLAAFPLTPADVAGSVRSGDMAKLVARLIGTDVCAIGVLGSTGIAAYLDRSERRLAVQAAVAACGGAKPIMAGVGALRTDQARALAMDAAEAGADWLVLSPISYTPLTQDEAFTHYESVAAETGLPLCIYSNPGTTHFNFSRELVVRLAHLPAVKAIKMPLPADGDVEGELSYLRAECPADFSLGYSADWDMNRSFEAGADCFHSAAAGLLPKQWLALMAAGQTGDLEVQRAFEPMLDMLRTHGSLRVLYACANLMGLTDSAPPRPLLPLSDGICAHCETAMARIADYQ
ncbi:MAG: dihydrodipicolinate synthase family protein, partial [Pseudomonadota bacterium]